ncbi:3-dehydroquinate synthase [Orenia metallireducens]|jgi:3-dehydroquinate synthase|uniref:3-dehydroquinate synthase n=1 Tax=Orenia metallireducens TaxID=1413210 RepID=A0A285I5B7_9FIRM|nr:3-dehydroquinate synthase [Orenia metallireducens]PRX19731.1 3-dehydroquinate synthase [Orenia metallireducens]SNY43212.1 3-dehydroquinate synthase [Orenia metallireducens]
MEQLRVDLGERSYDIKIGYDILANVGEYLKELKLGSKVLIITNELVDSLYGREVEQAIKDAGFGVSIAKIGDGEKYKSLDTARELYDQAVEANLDRSSTIVALGGGVVGDIAGFIASTYMRGVNFVQIPTTVLSQVDSSVGGKVAVNHPQGKNLIGAFYQPKLVVADVKVLKTLEERQLKAGLVEVIKHGMIWDEEFFRFFEDNREDILNLKPEAMIYAVKRSCEIKAEVVAQDEREMGVRAILNYGHTIGHALEAITHYQRYVHGEAVAIGILAAAKLANKLGMLDLADVTRQENILKDFGLPVSFTELDNDDILKSLAKDKKVQDGVIRFVLLEEIGRVVIKSDLPHNIIREVLEELRG